MQRPARSQSPNRVGSGPEGPPVSVEVSDSGGRGRVLSAGAALGAARPVIFGLVSGGTGMARECARIPL